MTTATKNRITEVMDNGQEQSEETVALRPLDIREFEMSIKGTTPLIVHAFSEKARKSIEDKQQQKATGGKQARKPKEEYIAAFYMIKGKPEAKGCKYGIPASGLKQTAVAACSFVKGVTKVHARGAFHVIEEEGGFVELKSKSGPRMREDTVRLSGPGGTLDLRYRPEFVEWGCTFKVRYNTSVISPEQIINLFNVAGFSVGLFEWRPQKNGSYGMFEVATDSP